MNETMHSFKKNFLKPFCLKSSVLSAENMSVSRTDKDARLPGTPIPDRQYTIDINTSKA